MSKTQLQENNTRLASLIEVLEGKAAAGSGSIEYEIMTIPAGIDEINIPYSLPQVTTAYGAPLSNNGNPITITSEGVLTGLRDNSLMLVVDLYYSSIDGKVSVEISNDYVSYSNGIMNGYLSYTSQNSLQVILINDPSKDALS